MDKTDLARSLMIFTAFVALAGCSGQHMTTAAPAVRNDRSFSVTIDAHAQSGRAVDYTKRYTDQYAQPLGGYKLRAKRRTYWFTENTRFTKHHGHIIAVAYGAIFVYPKSDVAVRENSQDHDLLDVDQETNVTIAGYVDMQESRLHKTSAQRSTLGWCGGLMTTIDCTCPDCEWDPLGGGGGGDVWSEDLPTPILSRYNFDPQALCALAGNTDADSNANCVSGWDGSQLGWLWKFLRNNCRAYDFYGGDVSTVFDTQDNPARYATAYSVHYQGLDEIPFDYGHDFVPGAISYDFFRVRIFNTYSGSFSFTRLTFYRYPDGPVGGAAARISKFHTGISPPPQLPS